MVNKFKLNGFSLLEASVVLLMVGIFIAMSASSFSKRNVTYNEADGHGRYECYQSGAGIQQRYVENNSPRTVTGTSCVFRPPRYAKYLLVNISGGGSGTAAGDFKSIFYSSIEDPITITPGGPGGATQISINGSTILSVSGGSSGLVVTDSMANKVSSCTFESRLHDCGSTAQCSQDGTDLSVSYCKSTTNFVTRKIPISQIKENRTSWSGNVIKYTDLSEYEDHGISPDDAVKMLPNNTFPSYFKLDVAFELTSTSQSMMENYLTALGITDGIATVRPGALSSPGGVVIVW